MPYRRRRYTKRRSRKRYGRKAVKRYVRKMRNMGMAFFKLRTAPQYTSDAAGLMAYGFSTTNPSLTTSVNGAAYVNACEDWANLITLYDQYRVFAVKITFTPDLPNDTSTVTSYRPCYIYVDYDSTTVQTTTAATIQYENCKVRNLYRPFTIYRKIPKSLNPTTAGNIVQFGWMDVAAPQPVGHIGLTVTAGVDLSTTYGQFLVTYYVAFKNRR